MLATLLLAIAVGQFPLFSISAQSRPQSTLLNVPYASQVPLGNWNDPRQQDGCEEASIAMALAWVNSATYLMPEEVERDIIRTSEYERAMWGFFQDTNAQDTAKLLTDYYLYEDVIVKENITAEDIKMELASNRVVLITLNTRATGLPIYRTGPVRHTIVVTGYDDSTDKLVIHDPLYREIQNYWISSSAINKALRNYDSGNHLPTANGTALISIGRAGIMY